MPSVVHGRIHRNRSRAVSTRDVVLAARVLVMFMVLGSIPGAAVAQNALAVRDVQIQQEGQAVTDPVITGLIETKIGQPFSMRSVRETMAHLTSLNRFEDVQVFRVTATDGVRLRYVLLPLHPVDRVDFRGNLGIPQNELRRAVGERFGIGLSAGRVDAMVRTLHDLYQRRGYQDPSVTSRIEPTHNPDRATLVFQIDARMRASITDVRFEQIDAVAGQSTIVERPAIRTGQPYDGDAIDRELQKWTDGMRARGYYEAQARHFVSFVPGGAFVTVNLAQGPYVVVAFAGDPLPESERQRLVPVRAEGSADEDLLEDSRRDIEEYLRGRGYKDASVEYTRAEENGQLTITFTLRRGPHYAIDRIDLSGASAMTTPELRQALRLKEGEPFVGATLDSGIAAIQNAYRARGYAQAKVQPSTNPLPGDRSSDPERRLSIAVAIVEGPRTLVRSVTFEGNAVLSEADLGKLMKTAPGEPYSQVQLASDRDTVDLEYRNRGFQSVVVEPNVKVSESGTDADVRLSISEGPQLLVDRIIIVGNTRTKTQTIERELLLKPGQPLGYAARIESQQRLSTLGLFRRVTIEEIPHGGEPRRDVLVRVEEAPPITFGVGGGLEGGSLLVAGQGGAAEERFEVVPRASVEVGRRNLWGRNRSVNLFTRVALRPRNTSTSDDGTATTTNGFNEYRVFATYREPKVFNTRADVLVTGILDQAVRSSFNFITREVRAEAGLRLSSKYSLAGRYSFERTELFDETFGPEDEPLIDRLFPQVRLSKLSGSMIRDTRDDQVDPTKGTFVIVDGTLAMRAIGSQVGFVKTFLQGYAYHRLPTTRRMVLATGARLGAAHGFPQIKDGEVVQSLPASERFFAGGDTTVRGFSLDRLGNAQTITPTGFPTGGNGEIVLNAELRTALIRSFDGAVFLDAGNVFLNASDITLTDLRPAAGFGVRYRSPVGAIRVDLGFNLDRRELVPGQLERGSVLHISLGQAF